MKDTVNVLMVGDVVGASGVRKIFMTLPSLSKRLKADLVVVNAENATLGAGLTPEIADQLFKAGAHVLTGGNHTWQKREIVPAMESNERILRPANYPDAAGQGYCVVRESGATFAVVNAQGREQMFPLDCPFRAVKDILKKLKHENAIVAVDFHAETAEEKEALALYLDGEVSCVAGTHTHVQTADERIFALGTGYITDIGMTGPRESVIGVKSEICVRRSLTQMPIKMEVSEEESELNAVLFEIDRATRKTVAITRVRE